jgi:hypothetical protein
VKQLAILLIIFFFGCNKPNPDKSNAKQIWGDRHLVYGDFNGDKITDTLTEKFISSLTNIETNKYYELGYDSMVVATVQKEPVSLIISQNSKIDTLKITSPTGQIFGINYLINLGDNNRNQKDEIGLIVDWADWSNVNSFNIYELNDSLKWIFLQSYEIRDFDKFDSIIHKDNEGRLKIRTYNVGEKVDSTITMK